MDRKSSWDVTSRNEYKSSKRKRDHSQSSSSLSDSDRSNHSSKHKKSKKKKKHSKHSKESRSERHSSSRTKSSEFKSSKSKSSKSSRRHGDDDYERANLHSKLSNSSSSLSSVDDVAHKSSNTPQKRRPHKGAYSRSRSRSPKRSSNASKLPPNVVGTNREKVEDIIGSAVDYKNFNLDETQKKLERVMQERRERVEKWREHQKLNSDPNVYVPLVLFGQAGPSTAIVLPPVNGAKADAKAEDGTATDTTTPITETASQDTSDAAAEKPTKKTWTLDEDGLEDDDEEEDDENGATVPIDDDEYGQGLALPSRTLTADQDDEMDKIEQGECFIFSTIPLTFFVLFTSYC